MRRPGIEDLLDDGEDVRMDGDPLVEVSVDEEVVDPRGVQALEEVVGGHDSERTFEAQQVLVQLVDQIGGDGVLDDRPAIGPDPLGVGLDGGVIEGPTSVDGRRLRSKRPWVLPASDRSGRINGAMTRAETGKRPGPSVPAVRPRPTGPVIR